MTGSGVLAAPVYNTPVDSSDWSGTRSIGSGLAGTGVWGSSFTLSWEITETESPGVLLYEYTFTWTDGNPSHAIIELSEGCDEDSNGCAWGFSYNGQSPESVEWDIFSAGGSNPGMPNPIEGVKVDFPSVTGLTAMLTFYSDRVPVWGNFYAKNGRAGGDHGEWNAVWNVGLVNLESEDIMDFIARPDTVRTPPEIPEPGTMALLGAGLVALGLIRRRG